MSKDNGGAAFPSHGTMGEVVCEGMALRDYFAAKAMQAALMTVKGAESEDQAITLSARIAYKVADAMIAERAK